jgi:hypothetical protein
VAACVWRSILGDYVTSPKTKVAPVTGKAKVRYYRTVAARKCVDGVESTYLKKEAYEDKEEERKANGSEELKGAVAFLRGSSPSRSEDKAHEEVGRQDVRPSYEVGGEQVLLGKSEDDKKKMTPTKREPKKKKGINC